ncbi:hypothetical protein TNCV_1990341 [Trichonephila clavipes]|nr:hypothetical protein TNCV_1990341 [Trichonephila clavipes]
MVTQRHFRLLLKKPYGDSVPIEKIECGGHVQKQMGSRLRKLKALRGKEAFRWENNWWERSPNRCYYKQIDDFLWQCYSCQLP